jgi:hypothetical protein
MAYYVASLQLQYQRYLPVENKSSGSVGDDYRVTLISS